jgi:hypothetical protein
MQHARGDRAIYGAGFGQLHSEGSVQAGGRGGVPAQVVALLGARQVMLPLASQVAISHLDAVSTSHA